MILTNPFRDALEAIPHLNDALDLIMAAVSVSPASGQILTDLEIVTNGNFRSGATAYDVGVGLWMDYNAGTPRVRFGDPSGNKVQWDGTTLTVVGTITASSGTIGGWTIGASSLVGGDATLAASGNLTLGTSNNVVRVSADDATYRLWAGHATAASAPFSVSKAGAVVASNATITGAITASSGSITGDMAIGSGGDLRIVATAFGTGTGLWMDYNAGTPRFRVGAPSGNRLSWDGTDLTVVASTVTLDASGITVASGGTSTPTPDNGYSFNGMSAGGSADYTCIDYASGGFDSIDSQIRSKWTTDTGVNLAVVRLTASCGPDLAEIVLSAGASSSQRVSMNRPLVLSDTTDASSSTTGSFKTAGGMGIAKKLYVGTVLTVVGNALFSASAGIGTASPAAYLDVTIPFDKTDTTGRVLAYLGKSNDASNYSALQVYQTGGASAAVRLWSFQTIEAGVANAGTIEFQPSGGLVTAPFFGLTDGVSAPSTASGKALLYVDTADGDLKVKFGDGTVKTIVTD